MRLRNIATQAALLTAVVCSASAQASFAPLERFPFESSAHRIVQAVQSNHPFTVAGEKGAILGWQDGRFELWSFPVKLVDDFQIILEMTGYPVSVHVNRQAATIAVHPDHTTITYSHAAFTVKQHMFAPRAEGADLGAVVLFEVDTTLPAVLRFRFDPKLVPQWPASQFGRPEASWLDIGESGGYVLASYDPRFYGLVAMPGARKANRSPYDEWPSSEPLEFTVEYDPKRDRNKLFPLIVFAVMGGEDLSPDVQQKLAKRAADALGRVPQLYASTRNYYARFFDDKLVLETPDHRLNLAFRWAQLAIDKCRVRYNDETGLVAGWHSSGNSARPGFGWFFGRDTLWSLYAVHSYGDFRLARDALDFLIRRQRADGKIMHEFSQTADRVEWARLPFGYAAADSTPLFVMAMEDYVRSSGDLNYLRANWSALQRAYAFMRQHDADNDGIYDNKEGTGWVETWKPKLPNQELYLAALDQQSAESFSRLARLMDDRAASGAARQAAEGIRAKLAVYRGSDGFYAFSRNPDGTYDHTRTIFPAVAWWSGRLALPQAESMLQTWASHEFASDWGTRSLSPSDPYYDPLTYHQGTVWPLFTGWSAMAQYRSGRPLAGYSQLMSSLNLTYAYDLGAIAEILSGRFFAPMPRGGSHQLWSSAMTVSVITRGMLGLEVDATNRRLSLRPELPADWDRVRIANVPFGDSRLQVTLQRRLRTLEAVVRASQPVSLCLDVGGPVDARCTRPPSIEQSVQLPLHGVEVVLPAEMPVPGSETAGVKVVEERYASASLLLTLEAPAGTRRRLALRRNGVQSSALRISGARLDGDFVEIEFPPGEGYAQQELEIRWQAP